MPGPLRLPRPTGVALTASELANSRGGQTRALPKRKRRLPSWRQPPPPGGRRSSPPPRPSQASMGVSHHGIWVGLTRGTLAGMAEGPTPVAPMPPFLLLGGHPRWPVPPFLPLGGHRGGALCPEGPPLMAPAILPPSRKASTLTAGNVEAPPPGGPAPSERLLTGGPGTAALGPMPLHRPAGPPKPPCWLLPSAGHPVPGGARMAAPQPPAVQGTPTIDHASALKPMRRPMPSGPAPAVPAPARVAIARSRKGTRRASIFKQGCYYICPSLGLMF
eukprot:scaffold11275_cov108-Isochrysis_galbana.AAC.12